MTYTDAEVQQMKDIIVTQTLLIDRLRKTMEALAARLEEWSVKLANAHPSVPHVVPSVATEIAATRDHLKGGL